MMKNIILCITFIMSFNSFSQEISFSLYGYNSCSKKLKKIKFFGLKKGDVEYSSKDTTGVIFLKEKGKYTLSYVFDDIDSLQIGKTYEINEVGTFNDTLKLYSIYKCLEPTSNPSFIGYCCCDNKCEGEKTGYYSNGNKRIEGCFKKGRPIGRLKIYYPNGSVKSIEKYNRKGVLIRKREFLINKKW